MCSMLAENQQENTSQGIIFESAFFVLPRGRGRRYKCLILFYEVLAGVGVRVLMLASEMYLANTVGMF